MDPPYRPDAPPEEVEALFYELNELFFDGFAEPIEIRRWSTDWSYLFDEGHEGWGAFLWTVLLPRRGRLVAVFASTTD